MCIVMYLESLCAYHEEVDMRALMCMCMHMCMHMYMHMYMRMCKVKITLMS